MGMVVRGFVSVALLASVSSLAWGNDVPWRSHYATAKKEARARNLPMLIAISCPGCGWCDRLHSTTFRDPRVSQLLKTGYVPIAVMSRNDPWLMQALGIQAYPTLILATPDGDILYRHEGYVNAPQMQQQLEQVALIARAQPALAQRPVPVAPVQPVSYQVVEPVQPACPVGAPLMHGSPYEAAARDRIEQARYEVIQSVVPTNAEVVPAQWQNAPQAPVAMPSSTVSAPTVRPAEQGIRQTTLRELNPIGPRYYGYPPPSRSPYAR